MSVLTEHLARHDRQMDPVGNLGGRRSKQVAAYSRDMRFQVSPHAISPPFQFLSPSRMPEPKACTAILTSEIRRGTAGSCRRSTWT
eukprot:3627214-Rhodomonas_salina.1